MRSIYKLLLIAALTAFIYPAKAQVNGGNPNAGGPGKIIGTVKDGSTKKPLEYTTVSVFKSKDSTLVGGMISDRMGDFVVDNIPFGKYYVVVSFIGYKPFIKDSIQIAPGNMEVNLGNVFIKPNSNLKTVEITGEKDLVTLDIDKTVYDVSKNITNTGGSATDVLGNVPAVNVDVEGNISLRGSESVIILIDGRPSGLTGDSRKAILDALPASSIESVEIISNPSAKYDADGMSGIINIKLKKDKKKGLNGSLALSAGTRDKYNANFSLNYRDKKFNFFVNYSYRYDNRFNKGYTLNNFFGADTSYFIDQSNLGFRKGGNHLARAGFDFYPNLKNTFSISGSFGYGYNTSLNTIQYNYQAANRAPLFYNVRYSGEGENRINYDVNATWKRTFTKKGRELTADVSYSNNDNSRLTQYNSTLSDPNGMANTANLLLNQNTEARPNFGVFTGQVDFVEPLRKNMGLEVGLKSTIRHNDNDFYSESLDEITNQFTNDVNITNRFVYHEQVYAGYASLSHAFKPKWGYKAGLRVEQTFINTDLVTTQQKNGRNYIGFFPTAHISYKPKDGMELRLSYSRRINRPRTHDLNPFTDYSDPVNLMSGNPNLNPEYINSGEFNVSYSKKKHFISGSVFYRYTQDVMTRFRTVDTASGQSLTTHVNVGYAHSAGVELISRHDLFKWWNITANINAFYYRISSTNSFGSLSNNNIGGFGRIISNWKFLKGTEAQLTFGYWAPSAAPQGAAKSMWGFDVGIKRDFWKNRITVNLAVTDIFNTRRFAIESRGENFTLDLYRKRESRVATLTVTLKLGKQDPGSQRRNRNNNSGGGGEMDEGF